MGERPFCGYPVPFRHGAKGLAFTHDVYRIEEKHPLESGENGERIILAEHVFCHAGFSGSRISKSVLRCAERLSTS